MDIILRDLDPVIVSKLDEMAKKNKQSRQIFLKKQIELMATDYMQSNKVDHLEKQLQANTITLIEVGKVMERMNELIEELITDGD